MSTFPNSPRLIKGGIALLDPASGALQQVISLQYNPDSLSRTLQIQGVGEHGDRSEVLRLKGPAVETLKVDAEIDGTDQLEFPGQNPTAAQVGIFPQLAQLELLVHPSSRDLLANDALARAGTLEIAPMMKPLTLFIWSAQRVVPVRLTEFSITEEAFDTLLNPIRAKVSLGMRVLNVNDLGFDNPGGNLFMTHLQQKELLAARAQAASLGRLGLAGLP